jgi:hypothetical protein
MKNQTTVTSHPILVSHAFLTLLFEAEESGQAGLVELDACGEDEAVAFEAARLLCFTGLLAPTNLEGVFEVANYDGVRAALERAETL